ncbi:MAG: YbhB/YbcL family Raf kinase inhibitor-like protein [Ilumatobacteraceae bacterium]
MRRVALVTTTCILLMVANGCRHDGRTLRAPQPGQNGSVSTLGTSTTGAVFVDPDSADSLATESTITLPPTDAAFTVTAPWRDGAAIDPRFTCDGLNVAPALAWSAAPAGTAEIAITLTDLDAPAFTHWVIAGLGPQSIALNEDTVPFGAYEATNGNGEIGYTGPCPPAGSSHEYVFTVHYLGAETGLDDGATAEALISTIDSVETASAKASGTFSRG